MYIVTYIDAADRVKSIATPNEGVAWDIVLSLRELFRNGRLWKAGKLLY